MIRLVPDPTADLPLYHVRYWVPFEKVDQDERNLWLKNTPNRSHVVRDFGVVQAYNKHEAIRLAMEHGSIPTSADRVDAYPVDEDDTPLFLEANPQRRTPVKSVRRDV